MCGIAGLVDPSGRGASVVGAMLDKLRHRGPDGVGVCEGLEGVTFGHRRLAIVDLSPAGHQPMQMGEFMLTYNGEIYNHSSLRKQLECESKAPAWRGHSDTETLLACITAWGLDQTLERADGMYAFALWDRLNRRLSLVRDRMGEKPLYYMWQGEQFAFASELDALFAVPGYRPRLDPAASLSFLRQGYVEGASSIVNGVHRLPAGTILTVGIDQLHSAPSHDAIRTLQRRYWSLEAIASIGLEHRLPMLGLPDTLEKLLTQAIGDRMIADVPVGAFLSGGVDSSLVAALMQAESSSPIHTFSIGFDDPRFDETPHARAVAKHIGTEHIEFHVTSDDALEVARSLPKLLDEPIADASQLPTLMLAKLARSRVTVALSGDGADELFAGYGRYEAITTTWQGTRAIPSGVSRLCARALQGSAGRESVAGRAARWASRASAGNLDDLRRAFIGAASLNHLPDRKSLPTAMEALSPLRQVMIADQSDYLCDDILQKVDRATMQHGLESRTPFLDHRIVEFSWRLPDEALRTKGVSKPLLRSILRKYVPDDLINRPKQGFDPPMATWMRGPLADWIEALLEPQRLSIIEGLHVPRVRAMWLAHRNGRSDFSRELWPVAMLAAWMAEHGVNA